MINGKCDLCGLRLPHENLTIASRQQPLRFCCKGCQMVYRMLSEAVDAADPEKFRETDLFRRCREAGIIPASQAELDEGMAPKPAAATPKTASAVQTGATTTPEGLLLTLKVDGMWCPACAWVIEETLSRIDGVLGATCNFITDRVRCRYDPAKSAPHLLSQAIARLGYRIRSDDAPHVSHREAIRFGICAFLTLNIMMLSFALYSGFFTELSEVAIWRLSWPIFVMASVVFFYGGAPLHHKAWSGTAAGKPGMELLISVGSGCAYLYSIVHFSSHSIHLYFDTTAMLITLVLLGKFLERRAITGVQAGMESFFELIPQKVKLCSALFPQGRWVAASQLKPGDQVLVENGQVIPADGHVLSGSAHVDASFLTGETTPLAVAEPAAVVSGLRLLDGRLLIQADKVDRQSTLGQMVEIVAATLDQKDALEGRTDTLLRWFAPAVVLLAAGVVLWGLLAGLPLQAVVERAVSVLVIACPCALGIAIPLARVAGVSLAAARGMLVRDFAAFAHAGRIRADLLDKTGTLTTGCWTLLKILPARGFSKTQVLALAAGAERSNGHVVARRIRQEAHRRDIEPASVTALESFENGVQGRYQGDVLRIGSRTFTGQTSPAAAADRMDQGRPPADTPQSRVYVTLQGRLAGSLVFGDQIRPSAARLIAALKERGHRLMLISGDGHRVTRLAARQLQVDDFQGGLLPQAKAEVVRTLQQEGVRVAMIGDGINDAPAMAQADLAVALNAGRPLGKETAHVTLMGQDPMGYADFLDLASRVNRCVHQNLSFSLLYNLVSIPLAASGWLTPLVAVTAMLLSSLSVTGNTLRLVKREGRRPLGQHPLETAAWTPLNAETGKRGTQIG